MKGATTEPLVRTISPPNTPMRTISGRSQNFLRARRKAQSSPANESMLSSELVLQGFGRGSRRMPRDPIGACLRIPLEPQEILAEGAHEHSHWGENEEEDSSHDERVHDLVQDEAEAEPGLVQRRKDGRADGRREREQERKPEKPPGT